MALPDVLKASQKTLLHETGSNGINVAATAGTIQQLCEIDNTGSRWPYFEVYFKWQCGATPAANKTIELLVLESPDGTEWEDQYQTFAAVSPPADTTTHSKVVVRFLDAVASKYKFYVKNTDTNVSLTVWVKIYGHTGTVED